ncbi:GNAT family N-acetyltransferase [Photobacterium sp. MCCC 1A19761]|uniref:GNAT family N-acetyltransferase n=1 Tax=Photobacterium sp. MCCC 1A19761 TaxID=3115000 RepID=UPI00307FB129
MSVMKSYEPHNLPLLIDNNQRAYDLFLAQSDVISLRKNEDYLRIESASCVPILNGVLAADLSTPDAESRIDDILAILKSRQKSFCWKVWSSSNLPDLGKRLHSKGLTLASECPGMAAELSALDLDSKPLEKLTIKPVDTELGLREWIATLFDGFQFNRALRPIYQQMLTDAGFRDPVKHYIGVYDGKPVATASCFFSDGVVGVYWVSTKPDFRGKGIAQKMMRVILRDALRDGYQVAILQSSEQGFPLYQKLGFTQFCKNIRYEWRV